MDSKKGKVIAGDDQSGGAVGRSRDIRVVGNTPCCRLCSVFEPGAGWRLTCTYGLTQSLCMRGRPLDFGFRRADTWCSAC